MATIRQRSSVSGRGRKSEACPASFLPRASVYASLRWSGIRGDRQALARDIHIAYAAGARLHLACGIAGIDLRTLQCWKAQDGS